jgi:preprotein translocase subunit SecG
MAVCSNSLYVDLWPIAFQHIVSNESSIRSDYQVQPWFSKKYKKGLKHIKIYDNITFVIVVDWGLPFFSIWKGKMIMDWKLVLTIIQLLTCLFLVSVVLLQSGKRSGLSGAIAGGADTFMSKQKATTWDGRLAKMTKWVGLAFVVLTLALNLI